MANFILLTGPFEGEIVEEGQVLDVPYDNLDDDLKTRIADAGLTPDDAGKEDYENSWDSEETEEPVTMRPLSSSH